MTQREISVTVQVKEAPDTVEATEQIVEMFSSTSEKSKDFESAVFTAIPEKAAEKVVEEVAAEKIVEEAAAQDPPVVLTL